MTTPGRRLSRIPLRVRLVAGFSVAMLVLLTAAGAFVYWRVEYALDAELDSDLVAATRVIRPEIGNDGSVTPRATAAATGVGWQVLGRDGQVLDSGAPAPSTPLVGASVLNASRTASTRTVDVGSFLPVAAQPFRLRVTALPDDGEATFLLVGVRRDHRDEALRELLLQLALAGLGALAVASLVGDVLARLALRPVERYRRRAAEISAGASGLRLEVPEGRDDEVTRLGHTLNEMLEALEESFERERAFVHDASHELRTPVSLLMSRIQLTRRRQRTVAEHEAALDELEVDLTRLADLAEQLLALSHVPDDASGTTDLSWVVRAVAEDWLAARPELGPDLRVDTPSTPAVARIGTHALERIVTNLVANALSHGRPPITIRVRTARAATLLEVTDSGEGMPPELLHRATRRFSRAVEARSRPGAGLGLSIVERLVDAAGGELRLCHADSHSSTGTVWDVPCAHPASMTVTVILPAATDPRRQDEPQARDGDFISPS